MFLLRDWMQSDDGSILRAEILPGGLHDVLRSCQFIAVEEGVHEAEISGPDLINPGQEPLEKKGLQTLEEVGPALFFYLYQFVFRERTVSGRNGRLRGEYGHLGRLRQHHAEDLLQGEDVYA